MGELPRLERLLVRLFVRGPDSEFVVGDLLEGVEHDRAAGRSEPDVRRRLRRAVLRGCVSWWMPRSLIARKWKGSRRLGLGSGVRVTTGGGDVMMGVFQDVRGAVRNLARRPGFSLGVALTLGLGIGATTTIFSVVDGVVLRPLPYAAGDRLVSIGTTFPTREWDDEAAGLQHLAGISMLNYRDLEERARSFELLAGVEVTNVLLPDQGQGPELVTAARVSGTLFEILGVTPALGRTFLPEEHEASADLVYLLSYGAWERRYGGDPNVIGRPVTDEASSGTIIGVLPRDFEPPETYFSSMPDYWMPLQPDHPRYADRGARRLYIAGLLAPGVSAEAARVEAQAIADQLAVEFPEGNVYPDGSHFGIGVNGLREETVGTTGRTLRLFLGAAALLLLLASMNAATLLLARGLDRAQEISVRIALGASRGRMARLLLAEASVLSAVGGLIGVAMAYGGVALFLRLAPREIPRVAGVGVDGRVLAMAAILALGAGLCAGMLPALRFSRSPRGASVARAGRHTAEPTSRLRALLVAGQMSVVMVLLSGAGLLLTSFVNIVTARPGFVAEGLVTANVGLKRPDGPLDEELWEGWDLVLAEMRKIPGVVSVAGASNPPFQDPFWAPRLLLPGDDPTTWREGVAGYSITPGYLSTVGTRLVSGRDFTVNDMAASEAVALVNEAFVREHVPGGDPVGLIVRESEGQASLPIRIVGVVEDVIQSRAQDGPRPAIYRPYTQAEWPFVQVVLRSRAPTDETIAQMRLAVARFSAWVPPRDLRSMEDRIADTRTTPRFQLMLIGAFAVVALLLASSGLYGSLAHAVGRRRREMGVRLALGADRGRVVRLVVIQGMTIAVGGAALGFLLTLSTTGLLTSLLYDVEPNDPWTLAAVALLLLLASTAACVVPASRATAFDPAEVLRAD